MPWELGQNRPSSDVTSYEWELYDLGTDFSQVHDLAAREPERLKRMQALFDAEARRNHVYPIQDSGAPYRVMQMMRAAGGFKARYVYWGKDIRMPHSAMPPIFNRPFSLEAELEIPAGGADGVIAAAGSSFGGWSFYLKDGKPVAYAAASQLPGQQSRVAADKPLPHGRNRLRFDFAAAGAGGVLTISVNGTEVAREDIAAIAPSMAGIGETFDTGRDANVAVSPEYRDGGVFTGEIDKIEVVVKLPVAGSASASREH
jgi:arylsulfatase